MLQWVWQVGKHTNVLISLTLQSCTASSTGEHSWVLCSLEAWHTTQMGSLSTRQKSFSFSSCRWQFVFSSSSELCLRTSITASQTFLRAKLEGALDLEGFFLHTGHSRNPFSQQCFTQLLQKLWLHDSKTGSVKISQHTGHVRSSSGSDMIINLSCVIHSKSTVQNTVCPRTQVLNESTASNNIFSVPIKTSQLKATEHINCLSIVLDMK